MLVLVRHGESAANAAGVLLGRAESPLTEPGRAQVARLAHAGGRGRPVSSLASPLGRARETAAALALDLPVEVDERWVEVDYGELEGEALGRRAGRRVATMARRPVVPPPGRRVAGRGR